jgi:26S proteasome regulatory subunit N2
MSLSLPQGADRYRALSAGSLNLLEDDDKDVRVYALNHLLRIVPQFWAEISDKLQYM